MAGADIETAESATAQLVHALTTVGVETSVLSIYRGRPRLELPFGGEPRRFADHLMSGNAAGGTPLSGAIAIARERVMTGSGYRPFVIVLTDGEPDRSEQYISELERCTFDVYGVYIDGGPGEHTQYFDRIVYADGETITATIRALARRLFR
jgi:Mg-chelatase subunit ChlD